MQQPETAVEMIAKAAPPVAVVGLQLAGYPIEYWIQGVTLIYLILMLSHKLWHMYKEWKTGKDEPEE